MKFLKDNSGATAIEYGLIAALIAILILTVITAFTSKADEEAPVSVEEIDEYEQVYGDP